MDKDTIVVYFSVALEYPADAVNQKLGSQFISTENLTKYIQDNLVGAISKDEITSNDVLARNVAVEYMDIYDPTGRVVVQP